MNGKDLLCGMSFIDDKFVQEAENVRQIKRVSFSWKSYITIAACFLFIVSMSTIIPNIFDSPDNPPDYDQPLIQSTAPDSSYSETYSININQVFVNDVDGVSERSFLYAPELHDFVTWNMDDIVAYYGKNPIPAYIPDWLKSSPYNENATILVDKIDIFDDVFISEVVGTEKPGIEFFEYVWEQIGNYEKDQVMIVGDSLTSDMQGGNNAGIICCWYNPKKLTNDKGLVIDYEIDNLQKVLEIL